MLCGHLREGRDGQAGAPIVNRRDTDTGLESGVEMDRDKEEDHETEWFLFGLSHTLLLSWLGCSMIPGWTSVPVSAASWEGSEKRGQDSSMVLRECTMA